MTRNIHHGQFGPYLEGWRPSLGVEHRVFQATHQQWDSASEGWSASLPFQDAGRIMTAPNPRNQGLVMKTKVTPWDQEAVTHALREVRAGTRHTEDVDPRLLMGTQGGLTHAGMKHYMESDAYDRIGETYADRANIGNRHPVVYQNNDVGARFILSGHHRATAALLKGQPLKAVVVHGGSGGWGQEAGQRWLESWK